MGCSGSVAGPFAGGKSQAPAPCTDAGAEANGSDLEGYPTAPKYVPGPRFSTSSGAMTPSSSGSCSVASAAGSDGDGLAFSKVLSNVSRDDQSSEAGAPMVKTMSAASWTSWSSACSTSCTSESEIPCLPPGMEAVKPEKIAKMEKCFSPVHARANDCTPDPDDVLLSMAAADERVSERLSPTSCAASQRLTSPGGREHRRVTFSTKPPEVFILDDRFVTRSTRDHSVQRRVDKDKDKDKDFLDPEIQGLLALGRETYSLAEDAGPIRLRCDTADALSWDSENGGNQSNDRWMEAEPPQCIPRESSDVAAAETPSPGGDGPNSSSTPD